MNLQFIFNFVMARTHTFSIYFSARPLYSIISSKITKSPAHIANYFETKNILEMRPLSNDYPLDVARFIALIVEQAQRQQ